MNEQVPEENGTGGRGSVQKSAESSRHTGSRDREMALCEYSSRVGKVTSNDWTASLIYAMEGSFPEYSELS